MPKLKDRNSHAASAVVSLKISYGCMGMGNARIVRSMCSRAVVVKAVNRLHMPLLRVDILNFAVTEVRPNREKKRPPT